MDFDLSKPQKLLKESARSFLSRECKPARVRQLMATDTAHDDSLWADMADQGWTGLLIDEEYGGLGLGLVEMGVLAEEMGRACLPGAFLSTMMGASLIKGAATADVRAEYLQKIASGELKTTTAYLEETANWDQGAVNLRAERVEGKFMLSGRKMFVPDASVADLIICVARAGEELVLVPLNGNSAGLTITEMPSMDETRKLYQLDLRNVRIAESEIFGADGNASALLQHAIDTATVLLCCEMVGGMQWILDTTVEYARTRQQFGRVIGSFQAVQHKCADMLLMTESARSSAYYAAWALNEMEPVASVAVSMAKTYCSDAFREVANHGVQIHGGIGFTWEHDIQLYYKRSKSSETLFGDATYHRELLAKSIVDSRE